MSFRVRAVVLRHDNIVQSFYLLATDTTTSVCKGKKLLGHSVSSDLHQGQMPYLAMLEVLGIRYGYR